MEQAAMNEAIKVSVVEDDDWIRENLARQINQAKPLSCVSRYRTAEEAVDGIPRDQPNVILMDINLPKMNGIDCVRKLRSIVPTAQIVMLTSYEDSERIFNSLLAGASGYLLKRTPQAEILEAIVQAHRGASPMSGHIARKVVQYFNQMGNSGQDIEKLSPREKEILEQLAQGAAYKEIADHLSISIDTVRMHIKGIYTKLHVHSRGEAVAKYLRK